MFHVELGYKLSSSSLLHMQLFHPY